MGIPESQLETWSHQGAIIQSRDTYAAIRQVLEHSSAPYVGKDYEIFLQGSYGNDTNIFADSDVDVVIKINSVYFDDSSALSEGDQTAYKTAWSKAGYPYSEFKTDVINHLTNNFPGKVIPGNKAILVEGEGNRRDADVLPAAQFRKYHRFRSWSDQSYTEGICFWDKAGNQIINYPKQHSQNCTTKHQNTSQRFKPTVRILKNMRNRMIGDGYLEEGVAPSYFLEGMLWNVPNAKFGSTREDCIVNALNWLISEADRSKLTCANDMYYLLHPTSLVTWRAEKMQTFLDAAVKYWKDW